MNVINSKKVFVVTACGHEDLAATATASRGQRRAARTSRLHHVGCRAQMQVAAAGSEVQLNFIGVEFGALSFARVISAVT